MNKKTQENTPIEGTVTSTDMVELKRDMQHAKISQWLESNQQSLIAGVIVVVLLLVGSSLWKEQQRTQQESAALVYMKASNIKDESQREALLSAVRQDYADTGYAALAMLRQGGGEDEAVKIASLNMLMTQQNTPEIAWQARLDLAELYIYQENIEAASSLLQTRLGKHYEQARYALLASVAQDENAQMNWLQKALDAESHDQDLRTELEAKLALLQTAQ